MTDEKKPDHCAEPKCPQTTYYVAQLGADVAQSGTMAPAVHAAAALGLVVAAGVDLEQDGDRVIAGVAKALTEAFNTAKGDDALRKNVVALVEHEVKERKREADAGGTRVAAMHLKVPAGTPDEALRKTLALLKQSGVGLAGMMAFSEDGTMLHSEGDISEDMIPPGAKAPKDAQRH